MQLVACSLALTVRVYPVLSLCERGPYSLVSAASLALNHRTRGYMRADTHTRAHTHHPQLSFCPDYVGNEKRSKKKTKKQMKDSIILAEL